MNNKKPLINEHENGQRVEYKYSHGYEFGSLSFLRTPVDYQKGIGKN